MSERKDICLLRVGKWSFCHNPVEDQDGWSDDGETFIPYKKLWRSMPFHMVRKRLKEAIRFSEHWRAVAVTEHAARKLESKEAGG